MAERSEEGNFSIPLFREVHKNAWLTKVPSRDSKKKKEKVWAVFCVHDDNQAYLEAYYDSKAAISHKPIWHVSLQRAHHISPTICPHEQEFDFVITLDNEVVTLAAPTWEQMLDWVENLQRKLQELRVLNPKENIYSKLPENKSLNLLPTRDPTSPLPLPPAVPLVLVPGVEPLDPSRSTEDVETAISLSNHAILQHGVSLPESSTTIQLEGNVFSFDNLHSVFLTNSSSNNRGTYDRLFVQQQSPGPSTRFHSQERSSINIPNNLQPPPQPYRTLREQQVLRLQKEMQHPSGVRLQLRRKDCISSIALVDAFNTVWVCGWNQKEHPMLYDALHIGDQVLYIDGIPVKNSNAAHKILRSSCCGLYVHFVIKRVPHGKVFIIRRDTEGQPLGIIQEGNTAVIQSVQPDSLVVRHGLPRRAQTCDGLSFTNWVLTEINGRPLNLFFKENQVRDRLNSVGREISILVQPLDLVKQLKKQMKSLKNYKDYILQ